MSPAGPTVASIPPEPFMLDLSQRVALVTGASRGIGRAIAVKLATQGATVVAAARDDHAGDTSSAIVAAGGRAEPIPLDVTDHTAIEQAIAGVVQRHGRLDILVSNAGITRDQLLLRMKRDDWDAVISTNLTAAFVAAQAVLRPMIKQRAGPGLEFSKDHRGGDLQCYAQP